ncbi:hypothetical protein BKH34_13455 [Actinomyces naeslundii]|nr:hypothetical protein BKH34_13455 [Actinomyces naeslundii]
MGSETDSGTSRLRMCLTRSVPSRVPDSVVRVQSPPRLPRAAVAPCLLAISRSGGGLCRVKAFQVGLSIWTVGAVLWEEVTGW